MHDKDPALLGTPEESIPSTRLEKERESGPAGVVDIGVPAPSQAQ